MNRSGYPLKFQIDEIILRSIDEDLNTGDATTDALIPTDISTEASIVAKMKEFWREATWPLKFFIT